MKILIVIIRLNPNTKKADYNYYMPLGIGYISSVLKKDGYDVKCFNLNHHDGTIDGLIKKRLAQESYDFILTGGLSISYSSIKMCVKAIRKYAPHVQIVLGGGAVSSQPELIFKLLRPEYIVIGEAEQTILELLNCLENSGNLNVIDGIGYRGAGGRLVLTKPRKPIKDIDSLPYPDYEGLEFAVPLNHGGPRPPDYIHDIFDYPREYPLVSSRSCPFSCTFCFHPIGNAYRQRSIPNIVGELNFAIRRYRINIITIFDELFSYNKERVYEFCKQIKELSNTVPWKIKWNCQIRVDKLDEELLTTMKESGCYALSLGLESYSPIVLKSMRKNITPQQIDQALKITRCLNMTIQGNFIFYDAAETTETAYKTLNYWKKSIYSGGGVNLSYIQPYPGTALYNHCRRRGIIKDEVNFLENITARMARPMNMSNTMTEHEFKKLQVDIYEAERGCHEYVEPLSVIEDNNISEIQVKCPYCNAVSIYKDYSYNKYSEGLQGVCCRNCRMRFYFLSTIRKFEILLIKLFGAKRVYFAKNIGLINKVMKNILKIIRCLKHSVTTFLNIFHPMTKRYGRNRTESAARNL